MMKRLVAIHPEGTITEEIITKVPTLEDLQKIVGGYIEVVPYFNRYDDKMCVAFCNEEGKLKQLPVNMPAQALWMQAVEGRPLNDMLVGSIAIVVGPLDFLEEI